MDETIPPSSPQENHNLDFPAFEHDTFMMAAQRVLANQAVGIAEAAVANEAKYKAELRQEKANAELDDKTGLYKPTVFEAKVRQFTKLTRRENDANRKHALILADFDKFHDINKILGYQDADEQCLIPTAKAIKADLREGAMAGRFGGEEIVVFVPDIDLVTAMGVGLRIQHDANQIKLPVAVAGRNHLGMSLGIVEFPQGADYKEKFDEATKLVFEAKAAGRNQIMIDQEALRLAEQAH